MDELPETGSDGGNQSGGDDGADPVDEGGGETRMTVRDETTILVDPSVDGARLAIHGDQPFDAIRADLDRQEAIVLAGALLEAARNSADRGEGADGQREEDPENEPEVTTDGGASAERRGIWTECHDCGFSWTANRGNSYADCPRCDTLTTTGTGINLE